MTPKAIRIANSGGGIIEHFSRFDDIAAAYINTPSEITLTGSAGTANNPILINPHETTALNLRGDGDSYVKGLNSGTVNLNDLSGNVDISSEGSIKQTADGTNNLTAINVAASGDVILDGNNKLDAINIGAIGGNFELKNDSDNLTATKEIKISTATFTHEGEIHTDKLTIATDNGVKIDNSGNNFNSLEISSRDGNAINDSIDVAIKADKFAPTIKNDVTGDVTLTNTKKSGNLSFGDGETINIGGTFTANTKGNFDYGSTLTAGNISIAAQNIYRRADSTGHFSATGTALLNAQNDIGTADNPLWFGNTANKSAGLDLYGKGIYVKGVNSGVLTLGDVVGEVLNASSEGSIAQGDGKKLNLTDKLEVSATNDITLDNADNLIKAASILDGDNVKLHNANEDGLTLDGLKAKGDVAITSDNSLTLSGNIESENISLTAGTDLTSSKASVLKVDKRITLKADVPAIIVTTNKGLDMRNAANNFEGFIVKSDGEQISGSVSVTGNSKGLLAVIDKNVTNDITIKNTKSDGVIILLDRGVLNSTKGNVTLEMSGNIKTNSSEIDIINTDGNMEAGKNIKLTIGEGNIGIAGSVTANKGNVDVNIDKGNIDIAGKTKSNKVSINIKYPKPKTENTLNNANVAEFNSQAAQIADYELEISDITIDDNGAENMLSAQNDMDILTDNGAVTIAGKIATQDGDIPITSNHDTYTAGQKGITVEETGAINPSKDVYLNAANGDIEFKKVSADNAEIKTVNGDVMADTIKADDTIRIELEHGDLYLNLAQSKGVAILTDSKKSSVNTIRYDFVTVERNIVTIGQVIPYRSTPTPSKGTSTTRSYGYSNLASNRSSSATID